MKPTIALNGWCLTFLAGLGMPVFALYMLHEDRVRHEWVMTNALALSIAVFLALLGALFVLYSIRRSVRVQPRWLRPVAWVTRSSLYLLTMFAVVVAFLNVQSSLKASTMIPALVAPHKGSSTITVIGAVDPSLPFALRRAVDGRHQCRIEIQSLGGYMPAARVIADLVEERQCAVAVANYCASACLTILAASPRPSASPRARFGVHSSYTISAGGQPSNSSVSRSKNMALYESYRALGFPGAVLDQVFGEGSNEVQWFTAVELKEAGGRIAIE